MPWFKKKTDTDKDKKIFEDGALVYQDPRTKVKTTSATSATTNTTVQNATIFNSNNNTVTYATTHQTVTHQQQARVTEIITRRTPTYEELKEMFAQMDINASGGSTNKSNTNERSRPPSLHGVTMRQSFKHTSTNPLSPTAFKFENPLDGGAKRSSTIVKTEKITVTQKEGRKITQHVDEKRIKLQPRKTFGWSTTSTNTQNGNANKTQPFSDAKPAAITWKTTTYQSPYAKRGGTVYSSLVSPNNNLPAVSNINKSTNQLAAIQKSNVARPDASSFSSSNAFARETPLRASTKTNSKKLPKLKPAHVYIFNHEKFNDPKNEFRVGSAADEKALCEAFEKYKCKVKVIKNATINEIDKIVSDIETKDFKSHSAIIIVILSHGTRHEIICAKDGEYSIDDKVLFPLLRNRTLNNKPKLFLVQACKGSMEVGGFLKDAKTPMGSPNEIYKCYSTFEGYASYRTKEGSIFIQAFCDQLKLCGNTKDIQEIIGDVKLQVRQQTLNRQIPTTTSNLTVRYVFGDYV